MVGNSLIAAGAILGIVTTVVIMLCMELLLATTKTGHTGGLDTWIFSGLIGFVFAIIMGWIPIWVPFVLLVLIVWMILDPMGSKKNAGG